MSYAPVQMRDFKMLSLNCETNGSFSDGFEGEFSYTTRIQLGVTDEIDYRAVNLVLSVDLSKDNEGCRYSTISLQALGNCCIHPDFPENEVASHAIPACFSLLYGAMRGYLSTVLGSFWGGTVMLPALSPGDFASPNPIKVIARGAPPPQTTAPSSGAAAPTNPGRLRGKRRTAKERVPS